VRQSAASSLASFPGSGVAAALRALTNSDSSYIVRGAALIALAKVDPAAAEPAIHEALHRDSWLDLERTAGVRALADVPTEAAWDTLLTFLAPSVVRETREAAIQSLLSRAQGREAELAQALVPVLDAPDFYSRADAAAALGRLKQAASIAPLEARRKIEAESRVINAIDAAIAEIRAAQ
jgi:HEAT repeat protein